MYGFIYSPLLRHIRLDNAVSNHTMYDTVDIWTWDITMFVPWPVFFGEIHHEHKKQESNSIANPNYDSNELDPKALS